MAQGDVAAALDVLRRLAEEDPQNHRWLREQGAALVRARRFAEAASVLEAAQARTATVEGERLLADAYAGAGRAADARQAQRALRGGDAPGAPGAVAERGDGTVARGSGGAGLEPAVRAAGL